MKRKRGRPEASGGNGARKGATEFRYRARRVHPVAFRLRVIREIEEGHVPLREVCRVFGLGTTTVGTWLRRYQALGEAGLEPKMVGRRTPPSLGDKVKRAAVTALRQEHPDWGTRRIAHLLARSAGLRVSETDVRRMLHEAGLMPETRAPAPAREHGPRRFERAAPNQLWQSDIFTFLLRKHERLYLCAFMDDHSRFIVGWALAHHQRGELVLEALSRAIAKYGTPQEILTDQGRQYTVWRGETTFEQELPVSRFAELPHGVRPSTAEAPAEVPIWPGHENGAIR
jgi:transposase